MTQDIRVRKVAWMPVKDHKVLFARSKKEEKIFYCVGGKIEPGETKEEALMREVKEETGVVLNRASIKHLKTFIGPSHTGGTMEMIIFAADPLFKQEPVPSSEVAELAWFTTADKHRTTEMGEMILDWYHQQGLID
ncbi:MAG TPA: NUDIX domain-containing protein [Candidatus Paceibacterota bacterium]|nr:NUDIX domain-containing protein [Candidatus Paceibacterota bacterium]